MLPKRCSPQDAFRRNRPITAEVSNAKVAADFKEILNGAIKAET